MENLQAILQNDGFLDDGFEREVAEALQRGGIAVVCDEEATAPVRIVLLGKDAALDAPSPAVQGDFAIAVVPRRDRLSTGRTWRLLQAGFADVLVWKDLQSPAETLTARLERYAEIETILASPLVKNDLIGSSPAWRRALRQIVEMGRFTDASMLITGESGTGKELVARLIHTLDARPEKGRLVTLDCTTVVPALAGSEFFGHERGAFTSAVAARDGAFALADKGTLFLDEVGELPFSLQAELLRVVQEHTYKRVGGNNWKHTDFRLICATNRDLQAEETRGNFRLDFYHRIAAVTVNLPPLRQRRDDILPLATHFFRSVSADLAEKGFDPAVEEFLLTRDYPGNVRELQQLVLRIAKRHVGPGPITVGDIPEDDRGSVIKTCERDWTEGELEIAVRRALAKGVRLPDLKEKAAEVAIEIALRDAQGNVQRAAIKLGVTDRALQMRKANRRSNLGRRADSAISRFGQTQNLATLAGFFGEMIYAASSAANLNAI
jgi:transcriptional regulator with GAF, ATPase, and Fis domain